MAFMNERDIKRLEDYFSSLELEDRVIIQYSFEGDINKPKYLLLRVVENKNIRGLRIGSFGLDTTSLKDIAKKGFKIAIFKSIDNTLKDNQ